MTPSFDPSKVRRVYIIAICGTGMASLAGLFKSSGFEVWGSDVNVYPPMSTLLDGLGIPVLPGFRRENILDARDRIDLVIVGNAVSKDNEEVIAMQEAGLPYTSFPDALARFFLEGRSSLVVAGTHGKTTTTALLAWTLHACGKKPGFMAGGWLKNFDCNFQAPGGDVFVTEGDEYDTAFFDKGSKFLHYRPYAAILTGVEFDHADIFRDLDQVRGVFRGFVESIDRNGFLLVESSDTHGREIAETAAPCRLETYGFAEGADWRVSGYRVAGGSCSFLLSHNGQAWGQLSLPLAGRYNAENAAAVAALCAHLGIGPAEVAKGFLGFKGIKRRQEVVGVKNGVTVLDDFAHHPTAIRRTIEGVREAYPGCRLWAVFEPRSASSRRRVFQDSFPPSFLGADRVLIAGLFAPEKIKPEERLDVARVVADIGSLGGRAELIEGVEEIVDRVGRDCAPGDVVLVMSSGGFGGIHRKLLDRIG
ncbi:MAG: UDP-N-acetylmuramate:L-alanyl-gamma-D-glutamyl-meso-diaminopimelate ligase [Nitrospinae bacterium CG11_big_fil_rev_8_21_14_0_20_56_8]|nr:MAG: UDP-N-acetylmuramate:L-alanyl-gamma-D-glutamyl-meso-diaminopimelate ligase [Nitrospinae bacterium CG11_big_fil_rev_8_21_14_0_20_56_8]